MVLGLQCLSAKILLALLNYNLYDLYQFTSCLSSYKFNELRFHMPDSPTWKSFEVLDSLPLGERSNSIRHLAQQRTLMHKHCVRLKKSQDLLQSLQRDCSGGLAPQSDSGLPDGGHILYLSEKKIVRKTLKRKCISMSVLSLEDHKQHVDKRWEDAAKSHGAKRIYRQLVIHRLSTAKRIRKQHGIHRWPFQRSAVGLPDGHILPLSEKKILRTILKRKFRSMNVLSLVDRKQHVDRRWEDAAKNIGAKCICRQLVIHRVSIAKRRQHGIHHRWPFQQDWATMKGYSLGDERPVEVISLSTRANFVSRLQLIYISWLGRFSLRPSALTKGGGEVGGPIALSLSESAATKNIAQRVGQDQSGSAAFDYENERTREQEDLEEIYTSITSDDLRRLYGRMNRKDAAASLGVSISTFKRKCREYGIKPWPCIRRKKAVLKPPDQHGEKNPPSTCKTLSTNGQTEMENEMVGHLAEMNEFLLDFEDCPNEAGVSSEWASRLRNQWTVSTSHPNSSGLVVPHPHMASQILGEKMGSLEEWGNSFASLEEPLLPSHDSGSMSTVPPCSYPVPSQPMPTIPHTLESSEDRRNSLAFLEDVFPEEHVSGSFLASVEDVALEEHVRTTGSSEDLRNLLASAEEHFSAGHDFGFINQIVPSCFDPDPSQSMPNTLHTMPPIPHMMPLLAERQDTRSVMLKATYGDITIKFQLPLTCGIGKLKEEVSKRLECEPGSYHVEYKDEDGTWIIINCDEDVRIFLYLFTSLGNQVIKLRVRDKVPNTTKFCQCGRSLKRKRP